MNIKETNVRVWQVRTSDKMKNTILANVSSYDGEDAKGNAVYSYWSAKFVGDAYKPAKKLEDGERIRITSGLVTCHYDKKTEKTYANLTIFDFEEPKEFKGKK